MRYSAFISYNHRDRKVAGWLHHALESYRFPRRLQGRATVLGPLGPRLPPLFRDREELSASADLAASVTEALGQAEALIVICSPNGARSQWVNEEIRAFTALGRRHRIHCLIVAGEPNASRIAGVDPALECLPPALFEHGGSEPLAADIRRGQDGRATAQLKLLAGLTGLPFDELRQREQARRQKRLAIWCVALGGALLFTTFLAVYALISRQEAIEQRDIARRKTLTAERTVDFVKSMFAVADPSEAKGATITAREIVDLGARRIDRELASEPAVRAELQTTLGEVYTNLGLFQPGEIMLRKSIATPGIDIGLQARQAFALAQNRSWQADDDGAAKAYGRALALARRPGSDRADLIPRILSGMGETQGYLGNAASGEKAVRDALAIDLKQGPADGVNVAGDLEALGQILIGDGRLADARLAYQRALRIRMRRQGSLHPRTIQDLNQLGSTAYLQRDAFAAERYWQQMLPLAEKVLGPDHPEVAATLNNIARVQIERRDYAVAIPSLRRAVAIQEKQRGLATSELVFPLYNLALALRATGHHREALGLLERDRPIAVKARHRNLAPILVEMADMACARDDRATAAALLHEARPLMKNAYPAEPWRMAMLDLIDASCRNDRRREPELRAAVLKRWEPSSHFGARAMQGTQVR